MDAIWLPIEKIEFVLNTELEVFAQWEPKITMRIDGFFILSQPFFNRKS